MRTEIILTVKSSSGSFKDYDVEIPLDLTANRAAEYITQAINAYKGGTPALIPGTHSLKNERTGKILDKARTLRENGVWQGDVLVIT